MSDLHKNFITPVGIASYVHILEKSELLNGAMGYNMALLIPKDNEDGIKRIKRAIRSAFLEFYGEDKKKHPKAWKSPLHDGDEKEDSEGTVYEGHMFLNVKAADKIDNKTKEVLQEARQPGIVGPNGRPLMNLESEIYSGMLCRCDVNFYGYKFTVESQGVGVGLNNVMKVGDGERLDGRQSAEAAFKEFAVEDDLDDDSDILDN